MFDTFEFKVMLMKVLTNAVSSRGLQSYDNAIVDELQKIAVEVANKTSAKSAETIAETAAAIAKGTGRVYILWEDIQAAIELKHCTVFPFCIGES